MVLACVFMVLSMVLAGWFPGVSPVRSLLLPGVVQWFPGGLSLFRPVRLTSLSLLFSLVVQWFPGWRVPFRFHFFSSVVHGSVYLPILIALVFKW